MIQLDADQMIEALGSSHWPDRFDAARRLEALGDEAASTLALGAKHSDPRIRAESVALMDHLADDSCLDSLRVALLDDSSRVRRLAVHSIGCQHCKTVPLTLDVVGLLIDQITNDPSIRVRRVAVHQLGLQPRDPRAIAFLKQLLQSESDVKLRSRSAYALLQQLDGAVQISCPAAGAGDA